MEEERKDLYQTATEIDGYLQEHTHFLKTDTKPFEHVARGVKTFEIRVNDRDFFPGDYLVLCEWNGTEESYTGRFLIRQISFMIQGEYGLPANLCVMGLVQI